MQGRSGFVGFLVSLPLFQAEWVLWLLIGLSLISVAVMLERLVFYRRHRVDSDGIRAELNVFLSKNDYVGAATFLSKYDSLETNIVLFALRDYRKGPQSVEDLLAGAGTKERQRYGRRLTVLATIGSNAPFIGLFGTVLGIIKAFRDLGQNIGGSTGGTSVMFGISEALVATAIGLIVAIPAVIAYNLFTSKVREISGNAEMLSRTLLAQLKSQDR